mgnify:CR=1 FL=1
MENWEILVKNIVEYMGFKDYRVDMKPDQKKGSVFIYDTPNFMKENLPLIVTGINHLLQMVARKSSQPPIFLDVNNYRQERENLIAELARAEAKKASQTKQEVSLPAMNSLARAMRLIAALPWFAIIALKTAARSARSVCAKSARSLRP